MPQLLTIEERQEISQSLARTDSAPAEMDDEVLKVARDLSMIHGRIRVSREESGFNERSTRATRQPGQFLKSTAEQPPQVPFD